MKKTKSKAKNGNKTTAKKSVKGPAKKKASVSTAASKKSSGKIAISNHSFHGAEGVISRRNQDGTVVLMHLADVSLFYKIEHLATAVWEELGHNRTLAGLVDHFSEVMPAEKARLAKDIPAFLEQLIKFNLVDVFDASEVSDSPFQNKKIGNPKKYEFGAVRAFNLEQIENEVLNESIYLDVFAGSDLRLKTDIAPIEGALAKVMALEGVHFKWNMKTTRQTARGLKLSSSKQTGVLAQQVAEHMPELVRSDRDSGLLAVNYTKLNAYLIEAVKELSHKVDQLQIELKRVTKKS
jgi:hypothetical protein